MFSYFFLVFFRDTYILLSLIKNKKIKIVVIETLVERDINLVNVFKYHCFICIMKNEILRTIYVPKRATYL